MLLSKAYPGQYVIDGMKTIFSSKAFFGLKLILFMLAAAGSAQAAVFLKKRITSVTAGAGATFFLGAAYGSSRISSVACRPEAQAALSLASWSDNAAGCLVWSASAMFFAAVGAAFAFAGVANWNWVWETAGTASSISARGLALLITLILLPIIL